MHWPTVHYQFLGYQDVKFKCTSATVKKLWKKNIFLDEFYQLIHQPYILPHRDIEGVIARANNTEYGLASGVFTKDINKAMTVADGIKAGTVFVNTYNKTDVASPFGGFKQSGFGKDLGKSNFTNFPKQCYSFFSSFYQFYSVPLSIVLCTFSFTQTDRRFAHSYIPIFSLNRLGTIMHGRATESFLHQWKLENSLNVLCGVDVI